MKIDQALFAEILVDSLARGEAIGLRVRGASMLPWLRAGAKVRILPAAGRTIRRGDVVLFARASGRPILHRVLGWRRVNGAVVYECRGDSEHGAAERVPAAAVLGVLETTPLRRAAFRVFHRPRRFLNRWAVAWGLRFRHD